MRVLLWSCLLLLALAHPAHGAGVDRIEPANWWVGMRHNQVELLVHGKAIARATPRIDRAGIAIVDVQRTDNPNYLFVTIEIAAAATPGEVGIAFVAGGKVVATHAWRIDAR